MNFRDKELYALFFLLLGECSRLSDFRIELRLNKILNLDACKS